MTYRQAVKQFKSEYIDLYKREVDYWTAQLAWAGFTDYLCKDGQITQKQWSNWSTPFPYGKHLKAPRLVY